MSAIWDDFEVVEAPAKGAATNWADFEPVDPPGRKRFPSPAKGVPGLPMPEDFVRLSPAEQEEYGQTAEMMMPENPAVTLNRAGKGLAGGLADVGTLPERDTGEEGVFPNARAGLALEKMPIETTMEQPTTSRGISFPYKVASGLLETTPKLAAVAASGPAAPLTAGFVFGTDERGAFHPDDAAVAAALPFVGKYSGEIVGTLAQKLGVTGARALEIWKAAGALTGAAGYLATIDESKIENLAPEQRDQARIDMVAGLIGQSVLGPMGVERKPIPEEVTRASGVLPRAGAAAQEVITGEDLEMPKGGRPPMRLKGNQPVVVPETPAEERLTVTEEIRRAKADTLNKIKALFPEAKLNNEQARVFRDLAFPKGETPEAPGPAPEGGAPAPAAPEETPQLEPEREVDSHPVDEPFTEPPLPEAAEPVPRAAAAEPEPEWLGKRLSYWETLDVAKLSPVQRQRVAKSLGVPDAPKPIREALAQRVAEIRANPPKPNAGPEPLMPANEIPKEAKPEAGGGPASSRAGYVPPKGTEKERVAEVKGKYAWNPLDIDVQKNEDGTYAYSASIQLSVSGMGGPMMGSYPTKAAAAKAGAMEIADWLQHEEGRNHSKGDVKTIAQIRAALEPLLAPAKESHPATTGPTTAEKVSREEIGDRPGANAIPPVADESKAAAEQGTEEPETVTEFDAAHVPTVEVPVADIHLSEDVPNFKKGADPETGVLAGQRLEGTYQKLGTGPITVWRRKNGRLEVISGRHRLDLARRSGEKTIPAQVVDEAKGFTKDMALTFDAEANIRDGQGSVEDYAHYFKNTPQLTEEATGARGLLSRAKGKAGWDLGRNAADDLQALWQAGKISEAQALAITRAAPGNDAAQRIGSKFALQGKPSDFLHHVVKAALAESRGSERALDLFGSDDSALKAMEEQAKRAASIQGKIRSQIQAVSGAAKNPETAKEMGVDVNDPEAVLAKVNELKGELARWENWPLQPDLVKRVREEAGKLQEDAPEYRLEGPETVEEQKARLAREVAEQKKKAEREKLEQRAARPLKGTRGDLGQGDLLGGGDLFSESRDLSDAIDEVSRQHYGRPYAQLRPEEQYAVRMRVVRQRLARKSEGKPFPGPGPGAGANLQGRQPPGNVARRQRVARGKPRSPEADRELQPAATAPAIEAAPTTDPVAERIAYLLREKKQLANQIPQKANRGGLVAQMRYVEGQLDELQAHREQPRTPEAMRARLEQLIQEREPFRRRFREFPEGRENDLAVIRHYDGAIDTLLEQLTEGENAPPGGPEQLQLLEEAGEYGAKRGPGMIGMGGAVPGEVSLPTIEDQIGGELAPERETEPPATTPSTGPTIRSWQEVMKSGVENFRGWLGTAAGRTFPRTTLKGKRLGELAARWVSSRIAARPMAEVFAADVLGGSGVDPVKFGAALTEDNLRSIKHAFEEKADEAENREEIVSDLRGELEMLADADAEDPNIQAEISKTKKEIRRVSRLTDEDAARFRAQAGQVKSFIGADHFPFATEEEYQNFLDDRRTQEVIARHRDLWKAVIEPQYREAMMLDPDFELPSRGLQTGARINLRAVREGEAARNVVRSHSSGNLLATLRRKSPFGVQAKGTGEAYHLDYHDLMENTFARQLEIANKNAFEKALVEQGQALVGEPGKRVVIEGQEVGRQAQFPLKRQRLVFPGGGGQLQNKTLYVNPKLAREYRIGADVEARPPKNILAHVNRVLNTAAISGLTDATVHLTNLTSALATLPGTSGRLLHDSLLSAIPGRPDAFIAVGRALVKGFGDNRAQLAALAEIGARREGQYRVEAGKPRTYIHAGSDLIRWVDESTRLALDDTYKRLAQEGLVENSETERREFINQVGQYNRRAQGYYKRLFRDSGFGPFVTAGTTFNTLGVRGITLNPGVKASSMASALALRGNMLAKLVGTVGTIAVLNYLLTKDKKGGGVMGRPGIPLGAIDLGTNDKNQRPQYISILGMIGPARGLRVTGARGLIESKMRGLPTGVALSAAERDMINAAVAPWAGPPVRFGMQAASGYSPAVGVGRQAPVVPPGQNQMASDFKHALIEASPIVAGIHKAQEPGSTGWSEVVKSQLPRFTLQPGKPEGMMRDYPGIVRRAQANTFIDDVIGRARKMEPVARKEFLLGAVRKLENPQDRVKAIKEFKFRKVL